MNKNQHNAIEYFKRTLNDRITLTDRIKRGKMVTVFEVEPTDYGTFWIRAEVEMTGLPEGNLLRFLDREHWFVHVGKLGRMDAHQYPKCFEQFKHKPKCFGLHFV